MTRRRAKITPQIEEFLRAKFESGDQNDIQALLKFCRDRARRDLWFFCRYVIGYEDIETELHFDMAEKWQKRHKRQYSLWLIPRGHLKTSVWTVGGTLWEFINDPDQRHLIVNAKLENAKDILSDIRSVLETNDMFRLLFPEWCHDLAPREKSRRCKYGVERVDFPCSMFAGKKEGNIEIMGVEASLVSKHYDVMTFDDAVNDLNTTTKEYRDKIWRWFLNSLQLRHSPKDSVVRLIGTRWHFDDIYGRILENEIRRRKEQKERKEKVNPQYLIYRRRVRELDQENNQLVPIWPERFTDEVIKETREQVGSYIFSCQYENNPVSPDDAIFSRRNIQEIDEWDIPNTVYNFAAIDLADEGDDYTVITVCSFDDDGKMYVRYIHRDHTLPSDLLEVIKTVVDLYGVHRVAIETQGFQQTIVRGYRDEARDKGYYIPWYEMKRSGRSSKFQRILGLQPLVEKGNFYVEEGISNFDWLVEEMTTITSTHMPKHDDILDTLADCYTIYYRPSKIEEEERPESGSIVDLYGPLDGMPVDGLSESGGIAPLGLQE